ncbi:MAG: hypothetical protein HY057_14990 [Rhodospirillales bacterium]|nr:hypothetical protein [Rhodospirillales bacterium]
MAFVRAGLILAAALAAGWWFAATPATATEDEPENLPEGPGREETFYSCTACHGMAIVTQQGMSRARWDDTIDYMMARHGMPELDPADRKLVVEYLSVHFPSRQRGATNPFLKR